MSKDDTILILAFLLKTKNDKLRKIYIVLWVQSKENFTEEGFIKAYLSNHKCKYCNNFKYCLRIAKKMYFDCNKPEYGINFIDTQLKLEDLNAEIENKLINFKTKYEFGITTSSRLLQIKSLAEIF